MNDRLSLTIVGDAGVTQSEQAGSCGHVEHLIDHEKIVGVAVEVAHPEIQVLAQLTLELGVPAQVSGLVPGTCGPAEPDKR
jgi:hypothetical protein